MSDVEQVRSLVDTNLSMRVENTLTLEGLRKLYAGLKQQRTPAFVRSVFSTRYDWYQTIGCFKEKAMELLQDESKCVITPVQDQFLKEIFAIKRGRVNLTFSTSYSREYDRMQTREHNPVRALKVL